ncbi:dTDP-4-dehydrorhamnose reductase [Halomonas cupida]|uniref:dTDP-4-dehydrorhamnose reductase n=1 Tax=Halomonas cupida TaxID=44933 RepID=A0A1M7IU78_9GAMM|nr:dTDP-4-dehydrorhamnose reductase [Halomonas cupida]GEN24189.1 NAD(P)-dependent oxidoreductase [Halomonas cupida]SHM44249.1 dTDP-4-dehydrorhamnose reductase [Halomonas cupida]
MKWLLLGVNGQVGHELQRYISTMGECLAPTRQQLDLSDGDAVTQYLAEHRPAMVVNAAAYTAVDKAEDEVDLATALNADLPRLLASYCAQHNALLVHYSSDYVYPGNGDHAWQEEDVTGPLSVYGQSKLAGDTAIQGSGCDHLIFRTSWVYSARGHNFMKTMLRLGKEKQQLAIVGDQIGVPTPARLIAEVTAQAIHRYQQNPAIKGLYHLAPRGQTSWHGFACEIFDQARAHGLELSIVRDRVSAIPTAEYPTPATRPLNSRLDLSRLEQTLDIRLPDWRSQLSLTLSEHLG